MKVVFVVFFIQQSGPLFRGPYHYLGKLFLAELSFPSFLENTGQVT
jgi:hypothetical protein